MTEQRKVALVTGATGFVGRHLCRRLLAEGWAVHVLLRQGSDVDGLQQFAGVCQAHQDPVSGDLTAVLQRSRPDVVFHLASLFLSQHQSGDIGALLASNIGLGTRLAEAMTAVGVGGLVNTGTSWQHYNDEAFSPVNLYAASKQAFECMLRYYQEARGLRVVGLKLFDTYGPADSRGKLIELLLRHAAAGRELAMSPGGQLLDLVYISDVVEAYLQAAEYVRRGEQLGNYAVSSGAPLSLRAVAAAVEQAVGKPLAIQWGGRPYRQREVMQPWTGGQPLPGWTPRVTLAEGLQKILDHTKI